MMRALAVPLIVALSACGTAEDASVGPTAYLHQDAQTPSECRLGDTVCANLVLRDLVGTPRLLQAYFLRRVGNTAVVSEVAYIENPVITANKEYPLVIRNLANEGNHYLAVNLEVTTTRNDFQGDINLDDAPAWTHESISHINAADFSINNTRRTSSWFEARDNRLPAAVATTGETAFEADTTIAEGQFIDIPNLRGRYDLEYIGWSDVFNLDGNPVMLDMIELQPRLDQDVPFDGHVQFPTP